MRLISMSKHYIRFSRAIVIYREGRIHQIIIRLPKVLAGAIFMGIYKTVFVDLMLIERFSKT